MNNLYLVLGHNELGLFVSHLQTIAFVSKQVLGENQLVDILLVTAGVVAYADGRDMGNPFTDFALPEIATENPTFCLPPKEKAPGWRRLSGQELENLATEVRKIHVSMKVGGVSPMRIWLSNPPAYALDRSDARPTPFRFRVTPTQNDPKTARFLGSRILRRGMYDTHSGGDH